MPQPLLLDLPFYYAVFTQSPLQEGTGTSVCLVSVCVCVDNDSPSRDREDDFLFSSLLSRSQKAPACTLLWLAHGDLQTAF